MTIHLTPELESDIRRLARERGRDVQTIVDEAVRQYVEASAITDVAGGDLGKTQEALGLELD